MALAKRNSMSWTLDLFWIFVPLTVACGFWDLGSWEEIAWFVAVVITLFVGGVTILRLLGYMIVYDHSEEMLYSLAKGFAWGGAMIFAWPTAWVGPVYLIIIFINFCLIKIKQSKKG